MEASRKKNRRYSFLHLFLFLLLFFIFRIPPPPLPRHFLFKPGGTSPMYCTTSPGYPLTSNTVYSPPPRPLPRNTFSRPAFSLKKPYKHCNWKCAALSAILISMTLLFLLAYFIGESPQVPLPRRFLTTRHGGTKHCMPLSSSSLFYLLFVFKVLSPRFAPNICSYGSNGRRSGWLTCLQHMHFLEYHRHSHTGQGPYCSSTE